MATIKCSILLLNRLLCRTSQAVLKVVAGLYTNEFDGPLLQCIRNFLDFMYLRSTILQSTFNYQLNYNRFSGMRASRTHSSVNEVQEKLVLTIKHLARANQRTSSTQCVLLHGLFTSCEAFSFGNGYATHFSGDVWIPSHAFPDEQIEQKGNFAPSTSWSAKELVSIAQHIAATTETFSGITWAAHSTACDDLMRSLQGDHLGAGCNNSTTSAEAIQAAETLRALTKEVFMLSPVLGSLGVSEFRTAAAKGPMEIIDRTMVQDRLTHSTLLLHEALLHDPFATNALLGAEGDCALQWLQYWRDLLLPPVYTRYLIAPLARYVFGWTLRNIAPTRRKDLLPHLFAPTSSEALKNLLHRYSEGKRKPRNSWVVDTVRCGFNYTAIAADVVYRTLVSTLVGVDVDRPPEGGDVSNVGDVSSEPSRVFRLSPSSADSSVSGASSGACRVTILAGSKDPLFDPAQVERTFAAAVGFEAEVHIIPGYEHMDTLWADTAPQRVFATIAR